MQNTQMQNTKRFQSSYSMVSMNDDATRNKEDINAGKMELSTQGKLQKRLINQHIYLQELAL